MPLLQVGVVAEPLARRLRRLPRTHVQGHEVAVAADRRTRLLGLALLGLEGVGEGLLLPGCRSVHTFGMRFSLDILFLGHDGTIVRACRNVPPRRVLACRSAAAVLELPRPGGEQRPRLP